MTLTVAVTQRVVIDPRHGARRDALDHDWWPLFQRLRWTPILIPNPAGVQAPQIARDTRCDALLFTGGNGCTGDDPLAPPRDHTEAALWRWAAEQGCPVLGVCRGLQAAVVFEGGRVTPGAGADAHVAVEHAVSVTAEPWAQALGDTPAVNSYHDDAVLVGDLPDSLRVAAHAPDGIVEAAESPDGRVTLVQWHPERGRPLAGAEALFDRRLRAA